MKIMIIDENLLWTSRLIRTFQSLGHVSVVEEKMPERSQDCDVAIVNLGSQVIPCTELVPLLKSWNMKVVAHAGHKEKELHELGRGLGCDLLCSNSELTWKTDAILARIERELG